MRIVIYTNVVLKYYLWKNITIGSSSFKNALSWHDHTIVLFLSHLLLFAGYFICLNSFLWSPNTNGGLLLWFGTLCQELTVAMFQIHLVSRCDGRIQQLLFFLGKGKEWKEGVTECYGGAAISVFPQSPRRHTTGWEGCWKFPTSNVPDLVAFFQPVLIPRQLQQTLLFFPLRWQSLFFVILWGFYAALVCTCLLICLVKLLRGIKMQTEIGAFPLSEKRDCIRVSACTRKANRKTDMFCGFRGGGGERVNLLLLLH